MNKYYSIEQQARQAEIYLYGDLTPCATNGETSAVSFVQQLKELDADVIHVHIDSCGGSVSEGWGIYNALLQHPARIITYGDGFVASAALYPFLAGDERIASSVSGYFFHEVMTSGFGYASDLRAAADEAEILTEIGIAAFVERTSMCASDVRRLMAEETWLTPDKALEYGLVTTITDCKLSPGWEQSARGAILARLSRPQKQEKHNIMQTITNAVVCAN